MKIIVVGTGFGIAICCVSAFDSDTAPHTGQASCSHGRALHVQAMPPICLTKRD